MEKEGVEEQFPKVVGKTHYEKLSNALDRRELRDFGSTIIILCINFRQKATNCRPKQ